MSGGRKICWVSWRKIFVILKMRGGGGWVRSERYEGGEFDSFSEMEMAVDPT